MRWRPGGCQAADHVARLGRARGGTTESPQVSPFELGRDVRAAPLRDLRGRMLADGRAPAAGAWRRPQLRPDRSGRLRWSSGRLGSGRIGWACLGAGASARAAPARRPGRGRVRRRARARRHHRSRSSRAPGRRRHAGRSRAPAATSAAPALSATTSRAGPSSRPCRMASMTAALAAPSPPPSECPCRPAQAGRPRGDGPPRDPVGRDVEDDAGVIQRQLVDRSPWTTKARSMPSAYSTSWRRGARPSRPARPRAGAAAWPGWRAGRIG